MNEHTIGNLVTPDATEAAHRAIEEHVKGVCPTPSECYICEIQSAVVLIVTAAAPHIAAAALRDAADGVDLSESYPTPGLSELYNAESAAEVYLRARADRIEKARNE